MKPLATQKNIWKDISEKLVIYKIFWYFRSKVGGNVCKVLTKTHTLQILAPTLHLQYLMNKVLK